MSQIKTQIDESKDKLDFCSKNYEDWKKKTIIEVISICEFCNKYDTCEWYQGFKNTPLNELKNLIL